MNITGRCIISQVQKGNCFQRYHTSHRYWIPLCKSCVKLVKEEWRCVLFFVEAHKIFLEST